MKVIIDLDSPKDIADIKRILGEMESSLLPPVLHKEKKTKIKKPIMKWEKQESPPDEFFIYATNEIKWDVDKVFAEFNKFQDHHLAKGASMADWLAAWRTWCTNSIQWSKK